MKIFNYICSTALLVATTGAWSQTADPDQNPNYQQSAQKYAQQKEALTASQSTTQQETYEAYDWREAKAEEQRIRQNRRYELRKLRIQNRGRCCRPYGYQRYYNNGFYHNYQPYNQPFGGYYNSPFGNYGNPYNFYNGTNFGDMLLGAGLGIGLYSIFN